MRNLIALVHPRVAVVCHDLAMVVLAWYLTNWLRFNMLPIPPEIPLFPRELPFVVAVQGAVLWWTGLYRGLWRFASLPDLWNIARGCALGALLIALGLFLLTRLEGVPRAVLVLYPVTLACLLGAPRWLYRFWKDSRLDAIRRAGGKRVILIGAGRAGETLVRDIRRDGTYLPVAFVDDDRGLRGAKVHGVPVLGETDRLGEIAREVAAEMILIALPSASNQEMQRIVGLCEATELPFRTVPRLEDVVEGRLEFNQLKEVAIEDLLGRAPKLLDWTAIRTGLAGRRVLVTGGGGSIGAELSLQVARLSPAELIILDLSEFNLYTIEQTLRREFKELLLSVKLGDVGDSVAIDKIMREHRPQVVFHAAAYKHVPMLQTQIREAFRNNVLGTRMIALKSAQYAVETFVLISTDKAVNPTNVMGASKRIAEIFCQAAQGQSATRFITVRFGNVLDSAGSVVPLFRRQLAEGGPLTVTHPEVSRYFMTIPEACQLIMQAAVLGHGGEIFVLDMGEPVKISYLAEQMIRLAHMVPGRDIEIVYTGLRPGEKLFEELFHNEEDYDPTAHEKIFQARSRDVDFRDIQRALDEAQIGVAEFDEVRLALLLRRLVPELHPEGNVIPINFKSA